MDHLRMGIHLRGYAQKNPKQEYKREAFELFQGLLENIKHDVVRILCHVRVQTPEEIEEVERQRREALERQMAAAEASHPGAAPEGQPEAEAAGADNNQPFVREGRKVGRNEPCPCGSGKKYKQCHGKVN
ncbi:MAG: preprotein translocase subunit SecA, partial [Gammaproteobacteria bacterium]